MKPYEKSNISLARNLRKTMTPCERRLWFEYLKDYHIRFQRQKPLLGYIADFYCAKAGLVIEVDGGGHYTDEQNERDNRRTEDLMQIGIKVIRISNADIYKNFKGACDYIDCEIEKRLSEISGE